MKNKTQNNQLVTYCIFTYNQESFIKEAIDGALNQTYSPLEIIISDDCSSDSTLKIINDIIENYKGKHKILINRNSKNLGIGAHVSKVINMANSKYIILNAGDDISRENHVKYAIEYASKFPDASIIDFNCEIINHESKVIKNNKLNFQNKKYYLNDYLNLNEILYFAPGRLIKKDIISIFGSISDTCPTEDSIFVLRGLLYGYLLRVNTVLVQYRKHQNNISNNLYKLSHSAIISQNIKDILFAYDSKLINDVIFAKLLKRINMELSLRFLYNSISNNCFNKKIKMLYANTLIFNYKIINFIKSN